MRLQDVWSLPQSRHLHFAKAQMLDHQFFQRKIEGHAVVTHIHVAIIIDPLRQHPEPPNFNRRVIGAVMPA